MGAIGVLVLWAGYALFYFGVDQIRGGNNGLLDLAIPGRYKHLPTDKMLESGAGFNAPSGAGATPNRNYKTKAACDAAGGTWYNGACYPSE